MELAYLMSGGAPLVKKYQGSAAMTTAGVPVSGAGISTNDIGQIIVVGTTSIDGGLVGVTLDTPGTTPAATGLTDSDISVSVIVNPDAVWRARMSGGAASSTAVTIDDTSGASADGTVLTGVTTRDDGMVWCYEGANIGHFRRADDASGSVAMNFPNPVATGDTFLAAPGCPGAGFADSNANLIFLTLTTELDQIRVDAAGSATLDNYLVVDMEMNNITNEGENNSFYHVVPNAHLYGSISLG